MGTRFRKNFLFDMIRVALQDLSYFLIRLFKNNFRYFYIESSTLTRTLGPICKFISISLTIISSLTHMTKRYKLINQHLARQVTLRIFNSLINVANKTPNKNKIIDEIDCMGTICETIIALLEFDPSLINETKKNGFHLHGIHFHN